LHWEYFPLRRLDLAAAPHQPPLNGTGTEINPKQGLIRLSDGTELRATDPQQLQALRVGDRVSVSFEDRNGRNMLLRTRMRANRSSRRFAGRRVLLGLGFLRVGMERHVPFTSLFVTESATACSRRAPLSAHEILCSGMP